MTLRWIVKFNEDITASQAHHFQEILKEAADATEFRDIVLSSGGTLERAPVIRKTTPAFVRRARARAR